MRIVEIFGWPQLEKNLRCRSSKARRAFDPNPSAYCTSNLRIQPHAFHVFRDLQRLTRDHRRRGVVHSRDDGVCAWTNIANLETAVLAHFCAVEHNVKIPGLQHNCDTRSGRKIRHRTFDRQAGCLREGEIRRKVVARAQMNRRGLSTLAGAGIIGCLIGVVSRPFRQRRALRLGSGSFNQAFEIGGWGCGNKVLPGSQSRYSILTEIVGALGSDLLPMSMTGNKSPAKSCDLGVGHWIAILVSDTTFDDGGGL